MLICFLLDFAVSAGSRNPYSLLANFVDSKSQLML